MGEGVSIYKPLGTFRPKPTFPLVESLLGVSKDTGDLSGGHFAILVQLDHLKPCFHNKASATIHDNLLGRCCFRKLIIAQGGFSVQVLDLPVSPMSRIYTVKQVKPLEGRSACLG